MGQLLRKSTVFVALVLATACTVQQTPVPGVTGPSELALSLRLTATPDSISQDGSSQSSIVVTAFDANGRGIAGLALRMEMILPGSALCPAPCVADYGTFTARTIVTGSDGRASTVYTAPPPPPPNTGGEGTTVTIKATPTGTNFQTANSQFASIRLVTPGVILPPANTPVSAFTFGPNPVNVNGSATFDGSSSCPVPLVGTACTPNAGTIVSYAWDFGDGGTATGRTASHSFRSAAAFNVTLTVTNDRGVAASSTQAVTVTTSPSPIAAFIFSPVPVLVNSTVAFNAGASTAASGHSINQYSWDFGDGTTGPNSVSVTHKFTAAQTYTVVLTVTDDAGSKNTVTHDISVGTGAPVPVILTTLGAAGSKTVVFDGGNSTTFGGATIDPATGYVWAFGDGTSATAVSVSHMYATSTPFTVRLTVTDSAGRTGTATVSVTAP
jgi:PKD repeat protein